MYPGLACVLIMVLGSQAAAAVPERGPVPRELNTEAIIAALVEALADHDLEVRSHLGAAIANYGDRALTPLLRALKDPSRDRRAGAAYALAQMRPTPTEALPALLRAVKDPDDVVRREAAYAISRVTRTQTQAPATSPDLPIPSPDPTPGSRR